MAYFAFLNSQNTVVEVIEAEQAEIDSGRYGDPTRWVQTSIDGSIRKNYAGVGFTYDAVRDAFLAPKPYPSWHLVEETCQWDAPKPKPAFPPAWVWNEALQEWVEFGT